MHLAGTLSHGKIRCLISQLFLVAVISLIALLCTSKPLGYTPLTETKVVSAEKTDFLSESYTPATASRSVYNVSVILDGFIGITRPIAVCVTIQDSNAARCETFDLRRLTEEQFPGETEVGHRLNTTTFEFLTKEVPIGTFVESCVIDLISHDIGCSAHKYGGERTTNMDIDIDSMESVPF